MTSFGVILHQKLKELKGIIVSRQDRSTASQSFAIPTLRSIDIFAGDLSWFSKILKFTKISAIEGSGYEYLLIHLKPLLFKNCYSRREKI